MDNPADEIYEFKSHDDRNAQYELLKEELRNHPGAVARRMWDELHRAHSVWVRNENELTALLRAGELNEELSIELMQNVRPQTVRMDYFSQLDQRLFNMIGSATALVEQTSHVTDHYPESTFQAEFVARNSVIRDAPASAFIRRFRNYLLHYGSAPMTGTSTYKDETLTTRILLDSAELLTRFDWPVAAREYLQANPEGIHLRGIIETYSRQMGELYLWAFEQENVMHDADLLEMNDLVRRINLTMTDGAHDGKNMTEYWEHFSENLKAYREGRPQSDWSKRDDGKKGAFGQPT